MTVVRKCLHNPLIRSDRLFWVNVLVAEGESGRGKGENSIPRRIPARRSTGIEVELPGGSISQVAYPKMA